MKKEMKLIFCFSIAFAYIVCGQDSETETTTLATVAPEEVIEPTDLVCKTCDCKDGMVDCSNKDIDKPFTKGDWAGLTDFKPIIVDLHGNELKTFTPVVELSIEVLNLSRNSIEFIENASFQKLRKLRVIDLSYNKLVAANFSPHVFEGWYSPEKFEPLDSMRVLNLAHNDLHSIQQDLFEHVPELTELDLSGNPLEYLDHVTIFALSSLTMLKVLRLRSCSIKSIPDRFLHTPRMLEHLDLSDNQLTAIPQELEETKNLRVLNLNQNPIVELDSDSEDFRGFPNMPKLEEVHMCNMPSLKYIGPWTLAGLSNIKRVHISHNPKLSKIDGMAFAKIDDFGENYDWPKVKELYLRDNALTELDSQLLARWELLEKIDISNNPFLCDCSTQWMVNKLVPIIEGTEKNSTENLVCANPIEMKGLTMKQIYEGHRTMRCVDKYGHRPERDGAILLGTLIGALLAVPIMLGIVMLWRRGYCAWIGAKGPTDVSRAFYKRAPSDENYI